MKTYKVMAITVAVVAVIAVLVAGGLEIRFLWQQNLAWAETFASLEVQYKGLQAEHQTLQAEHSQLTLKYQQSEAQVVRLNDQLVELQKRSRDVVAQVQSFQSQCPQQPRGGGSFWEQLFQVIGFLAPLLLG